VVQKEQEEAFIKPQRKIEEERPFREEQSDLRFFDVKVKLDKGNSTSSGSGSSRR